MARGSAGLMLLAVTGCTVGPDHRPPSAASLNLPGDFHAPSGDAADQAELATWWTRFNDPVLSALVDKAIRNNNDLAAAQARLRAARAALRAAHGSQLPTLSASGSVTRQQTLRGSNGGISIIPGGGSGGTGVSVGDGSTIYQGGLDASWEADIFGGLRRTAEAAHATMDGTAATLANVQATLVSEVGLNYISARQAQARLTVARANLAIQDNTVQIVRWREQAGLIGNLDLQQAIAQRAQTAANLPTLEQNYETAANAISVLLGEAPGPVSDQLSAAQPIPLGPDNVEAGVPAQLLSRRPDVISAERSLAAEVARIGVAEAQLYPALRLSGTLSTNARNSIGDLGSSIIGNVLGSLSAPLFQGGRLRAGVDQQRATADAALATYRGTVLTAVQDVENALVSIDRNKTRETELTTAESAAAETVRLAETQYQSGLVDFQTLLTAQQSLLTAQDSRTTARAARATATVQLFKALGGGWNAPASAQAGSR